MNIDVNTARELAYGQPGDYVDGFEVMVNELIDTSRWSIYCRLVIRNPYDGKFWSTIYSEGATEDQDEIPFEDDEVADFQEVEPVEVRTIEYREVK